MIKIVTFGGGGGQAQILSSLNKIPNLDITAICTASDSGGSTGILRKEYRKDKVCGYIGDVSKCLWALSNKTKLENTMMFRFTKGKLENHSLKNLIYTALIIENGPTKALQLMHKVFGLNSNHKVFPVSIENTTLHVKLKSGQVIPGETYIDTISRNNLWHPEHNKIVDVWLNPKVKMLPQLKQVIENADYIMMCPGDLFTSLIPSLLPLGVSNAIAKSKAKIIFITNIMTKLGETDEFTISDFINQVTKRIENREPDYVISNNGKIPINLLKKYKIREHKVEVVLPDKKELSALGIILICENLWAVDKKGHVRHNSEKITKVLTNIFYSNK